MSQQEKYIDIAQTINRTLAEMRDRNNQRRQKFLELNQTIDDIQKEIKANRRWIVGIAIATIIGIVAMVVTVLLKK